MEDMDLLLPLLSGLIGGCFVILATFTANRLGGLIGGLVSSVPSVVVIASIGLALESDSATEVQEALYSGPVGGFINTFYIFIWVYLPLYIPKDKVIKPLHRVLIVSGVAFLVWLIFTLLTVFVFYPEVPNEHQQVYAVLFLFLTYYISSIHRFSWKEVVPRQPKTPLTIRMAILRFSVGFILVVTIILLAKVNETLAAILTVFPAFCANQYVLWFGVNGEEVVRSFSSSTAIGNISVYVYVLLFAVLLPRNGPWISAFVSLILSMLTVTLPLFLVLRPPSQTKQTPSQMDLMTVLDAYTKVPVATPVAAKPINQNPQLSLVGVLDTSKKEQLIQPPTPATSTSVNNSQVSLL